jgi:hypothetical protein
MAINTENKNTKGMTGGRRGAFLLPLLWATGLLVGCSPGPVEEERAPIVEETPAAAAGAGGEKGMSGWSKTTTSAPGLEEPGQEEIPAESLVEAPAPASELAVPESFDPGVMDLGVGPPPAEFWGADGSWSGQEMPAANVPVLQGADDPVPGQPAASEPVPVLQGADDLWPGETEPRPEVPVLQGADDPMPGDS